MCWLSYFYLVVWFFYTIRCRLGDVQLLWNSLTLFIGYCQGHFMEELWLYPDAPMPLAGKIMMQLFIDKNLSWRFPEEKKNSPSIYCQAMRERERERESKREKERERKRERVRERERERKREKLMTWITLGDIEGNQSETGDRKKGNPPSWSGLYISW